MTCGPDLVHHHVGVALEQRHHGGHPVGTRRCSRRLDEVEQRPSRRRRAATSGRLRAAARRAASSSGRARRAGRRPAHAAARAAGGSRSHGLAANCTRWVSSCRQPTAGSRPGRRAAPARPATTLGATSSSRPAPAPPSSGPPRDVVLAEHLAGQESQQRTDLGAGDAPPTRWRVRSGCSSRRRWAAPTAGASTSGSRRRSPAPSPAGPRRSTPLAGRARAARCRATWPVDATAASRSSCDHVPAPASRLTAGPGRTRRSAVRTARSQSTSGVDGGVVSC